MSKAAQPSSPWLDDPQIVGLETDWLICNRCGPPSRLHLRWSGQIYHCGTCDPSGRAMSEARDLAGRRAALPVEVIELDPRACNVSSAEPIPGLHEHPMIEKLPPDLPVFGQGEPGA